MNKRNMLVSIIITISLVIGLFFFFSNSGAQKATSEEDQLIASETMTVENLISNAKTLKEIHVFHEDDKVSLIKRDTGAWDGVDLEREQDRVKVDNTIVNILSLQGMKVNEVSEDDTGLKSPFITLELIDETGALENVYIGSLSQDKRFYYVSLATNKVIYQVPIEMIEQLPLESHDLTNNAITDIKSDTVKHITIDNGKQTIELLPSSSYLEEEVRTNLSGWFMHQPYKGVYSVKYNKMADMLYGIDKLEFEEVIGEHVEGDHQYGLTDVNHSITIATDSKQDTILIGKLVDDHSYFAKMKSDNKVFTISKKVLEPYSFQAFDIVDQFVKILALDVLSKVKVNTPEDEIVMVIKQKNMQTSSESKQNLEFQLNDQLIEDKEFRDLYKSIAGLSVTGEVLDAQYKQAESTITYTLNLANNDTKEIIVEFVPYNDRHYAVFIDQSADFIIEKQRVQEMIELLNK
ncbi:DUF4340 domain-containing protein [Litchfieldia salsa]|uniref:DUF4340 domain-containing protein n=1 Tax=Litchfieldia salsa TaxID=930152 RepID=A0A1H0Q765_9BACI|nr:DUF4340 domain-containing protein [Litchfieldia salsa]SDP13257.1 protein of unknown function [Litchfieldia salsa]